jgi:hypothetical protein
MRNSRTSPPAARTAITLRMSRVRRAGNTRTSRSVTALPTTAGISRKGMKVAIATSGNDSPPSYATPYATKIGTAIKTTIQLECTAVSSSLAP